jgi:hypothetical protein
MGKKVLSVRLANESLFWLLQRSYPQTEKTVRHLILRAVGNKQETIIPQTQEERQIVNFLLAYASDIQEFNKKRK